jgi:hypothetical protein
LSSYKTACLQVIRVISSLLAVQKKPALKEGFSQHSFHLSAEDATPQPVKAKSLQQVTQAQKVQFFCRLLAATSRMAPEKRGKKGDGGKPHKDEQHPAAAPGLRSSEEEAFPRGGASALTARERREIHLAAEKEVEKELAQVSVPRILCLAAPTLHSLHQSTLHQSTLLYLFSRKEHPHLLERGRRRRKGRQAKGTMMSTILATSWERMQAKDPAMLLHSSCRSVHASSSSSSQVLGGEPLSTLTYECEKAVDPHAPATAVPHLRAHRSQIGDQERLP